MGNNFIIIGGIIYLLLGAGHLAATVFTAFFEPKDKALLLQLKTQTAKITNATTIWNATYGFHISHSLGILVVGSLAIYFQVYYSDTLMQTNFIKAVFVSCALIYALLAVRYWFIVPAIGFLTTLALWTLGWLVL